MFVLTWLLLLPPLPPPPPPPVPSHLATLQMIRLVEPYVAYGYPSLKSVRDLIYKRGFVKLNGQRKVRLLLLLLSLVTCLTPLPRSQSPTTWSSKTNWKSKVLCALKTWSTRSTLSARTSKRWTNSCGHLSCRARAAASATLVVNSPTMATLVTANVTSILWSEKWIKYIVFFAIDVAIWYSIRFIIFIFVIVFVVGVVVFVSLRHMWLVAGAVRWFWLQNKIYLKTISNDRHWHQS